MIEFFAEDTKFDVSLLDAVPGWLQRVADNHQATIASLTYVFCSDNYLLAINRQYLSHDYFTDVITFDQSDGEGYPIEGNIFISIDRVYENADFYCVPRHHELLRVIVHGLLHLLGYKDDTKESKQRMRCSEDEALHLYKKLNQ